MDCLSLISDVGLDDVTPDHEDVTMGLTDATDPYTTENFRTIRGGYKQLTDVHQVLAVDFNDKQVRNRGVEPSVGSYAT